MRGDCVDPEQGFSEWSPGHELVEYASDHHDWNCREKYSHQLPKHLHPHDLIADYCAIES